MIKPVGCVNLKESPLDKPITLNVTYETPMRDLEEERKYTSEYLNYASKAKRLQHKIYQDVELLKMVMNVQNIQIEKLNEIIKSNSVIDFSFLSTLYCQKLKNIKSNN